MPSGELQPCRCEAPEPSVLALVAPGVTWLLVVAGWLVTHASAQRRARRQEELQYEALRAQVSKLQEKGSLPKKLTRDDAVDWVYGNTAIENPNITRAMVERAYDAAQETKR